MKKLSASILIGLVSTIISTSPAQAGDRYSTPPKAVLSANLAEPWLLQMRNKPIRIKKNLIAKTVAVPRQTSSLDHTRVNTQTAAIAPTRQRAVQQKPFNPRFMPQIVNYQTKHAPGTIIISTKHKYLYLVMGNGQARRYGVGVGKQGFTWSGTKKITRKKEWPGWTPPKEMIAREKKKGKILPAHMPGGPDNPLGARALYLGSTLYRIHGTTQPWSIGMNISSGCIRMRNEDVTDLYERVKVGTKVVVL